MLAGAIRLFTGLPGLVQIISAALTILAPLGIAYWSGVTSCKDGVRIAALEAQISAMKEQQKNDTWASQFSFELLEEWTKGNAANDGALDEINKGLANAPRNPGCVAADFLERLQRIK